MPIENAVLSTNVKGSSQGRAHDLISGGHVLTPSD